MTCPSPTIYDFPFRPNLGGTKQHADFSRVARVVLRSVCQRVNEACGVYLRQIICAHVDLRVSPSLPWMTWRSWSPGHRRPQSLRAKYSGLVTFAHRCLEDLTPQAELAHVYRDSVHTSLALNSLHTRCAPGARASWVLESKEVFVLQLHRGCLHGVL